MRGNWIPLGGNWISFGGNWISFGGNWFSVRGKWISFGGNWFSIRGNWFSFGGNRPANGIVHQYLCYTKNKYILKSLKPFYKLLHGDF